MYIHEHENLCWVGKNCLTSKLFRKQSKSENRRWSFSWNNSHERHEQVGKPSCGKVSLTQKPNWWREQQPDWQRPEGALWNLKVQVGFHQFGSCPHLIYELEKSSSWGDSRYSNELILHHISSKWVIQRCGMKYWIQRTADLWKLEDPDIWRTSVSPQSCGNHISILSRAWTVWFVPTIDQRPTYCKNLWLPSTPEICKGQAVEL